MSAGSNPVAHRATVDPVFLVALEMRSKQLFKEGVLVEHARELLAPELKL